jgi:hypothetical protein
MYRRKLSLHFPKAYETKQRQAPCRWLNVGMCCLSNWALTLALIVHAALRLGFELRADGVQQLIQTLRRSTLPWRHGDAARSWITVVHGC